MVHLGGKLPRAYADATLQAIQNNNGGVATNIATVMQQLATEKAKGASVVDGYIWTVNKANTASKTETGLKPIAARQLVSQLAQSKDKLAIAKLDAIHEIAKNNGIVTPYSSTIVLVNDRQREQLKAAEAQADRFDREIETGVEQLDTPFDPLSRGGEVSGVPEPDVWILLGIVAIALSILYQRQRLLSTITRQAPEESSVS